MNKRKYSFLNNKKFKIKQLLLLAIIILSSLTVIVALARYVLNSVNDFFMRSKEFYFYSDKLKENMSYYEINNWSGVDDYTFTINMNSNENNLKSATYDIDYDISYECSDNIICQLSKNKGRIAASTNSDYFNIVVTPNMKLNTGDEIWVKITTKANSKYQKTLSGKFVLKVGKEELTYEIVDSVNNPYCELNITNTLSYYFISQPFDTYSVGDRIDRDKYLSLSEDNRKKCYSALVTLNFDPKEVLLDMTNTNYLNATSVSTQNINGVNYINQISFKVDAVSSTNVRFYKSDITKDYTYPIVNTKPIIKLTSK